MALYASDMPTRYRFRKGDDAQLVTWILQGVARLGLEELYLSAAYAHGYRLLELANLATAEHTRAHSARFTNGRRLDRAESVAGIVGIGPGRIPCSASAIARNRRPMVEGACICGGTGWFEICFEPGEPTAVVSQNCPAHNPTGDRPNQRVAVTA
ncbi:hypothetical protein AB0I52_02590 [Streptomyces sp. NPDC050423]|uniref:hypothetical protein n=1 Tax=Streptomyces sp. NPDC050423 TaxID=3155402 RepID=UPI00342A3534